MDFIVRITGNDKTRKSYLEIINGWRSAEVVGEIKGARVEYEPYYKRPRLKYHFKKEHDSTNKSSNSEHKNDGGQDSKN